MEFDRGLVIGKFLPPHRGHRHLIETAAARCRRLTIIVCGKPTDPIPPELRRAWLAEMFPAAEVMLIDDRYDENDSRVWAENTIAWLGRAPDVVFTSEAYGDPYAAHLGCTHVSVDPARGAVACSGTMVRNDPYANWRFIDPPVRGWYARRVCVLGAESTGTTTLARALAEALDTVWVEEYGREYSADKFASGVTTWTTDEFVAIAREQCRREDEAARRANRVLVCDTNALATRLWHRRYVGGESIEVKCIADSQPCDLYLLTGDEIPFVQDGLRDGEHIRSEMHSWFRQALADQPVAWIELRGDPDERLTRAVTEVARLFIGSEYRPGYRGS
jgi:NadR type nicotinamide-nucleotide adenylyltransferase